jgi:predicted alpha/beta-hydrolase family hydrolase
MSDENYQITVGDKTVSTIRTSPDGDARFTFVYAPGAGSNIKDPFGEYLSARLSDAGASLVRFQFPYMETGKRAPDRPPLLEATWRAVIDTFRADSGKLVVGGRSMGGRIASQVAAQGTEVDAVALFAYPLNPPGKRAAPRDGHLPDIAVPTLFCSGTRDSFATPDDLTAVAGRMPNGAFHVLDGADHGFAVLKRSGRAREDVWKEAADVLLEWFEGISK